MGESIWSANVCVGVDVSLSFHNISKCTRFGVLIIIIFARVTMLVQLERPSRRPKQR